MKRLTLLLAPIAALLTLSGCLQNEITVNVNADGSGTVVEETLLGAQMTAMLGGLGGLGGGLGGEAGAPAADPLAEMFNEKSAKEKAAKMGEGVTFEKLEKLDREGKKGARITYAFKDINLLKLALDSGTEALEGAGKGMAEGLPGADAAVAEAEAAKEKSEPVRFKKEGGKLTIIMPKPDQDATAEKPEIPEGAADAAQDAQAQAMMQAMFADMKMAIRVRVAPGIKKTNASHVEGDTITLMEMNFGELMKNAEGMKVLEQMEDKKPEELAAMLKDIKGVKMETQEQVAVELK